ncbi:MAG: hypothetical protein GY859_25650, partial [Desulfobacterales bacterium]|nr:hypothetical protein [Desulfobacterales bacterium]
EKIDLNFVSSSRPGDGGADWTHFNAIEYIESFDQILISVHEFSEIWVIDHGVTTAEASGDSGGRYGKGGGLLYRWGNPRTHGAGAASDQVLFKQHDASWIPSGYPGEGNILIFNNGAGRPDGNYSSVEEISPPVDESGAYTLVSGSAYGPASPAWVYTAPDPTDFFSQNISGAQRLANGATLICSGADGRFFEVTPEKEIVWEYVNPVAGGVVVDPGDPIPSDNMGNQMNQVFKVFRYADNYAGLAETPGVSVAPAPDIKANGSDGPVTLGPGEALSVTISLQPGARENENANWWIAGNTPSNDWMYLDISGDALEWADGL